MEVSDPECEEMSTNSPVLVLSPSWRDTLASLLERPELSKQRFAVPVENATKGLTFIALLQDMQKAAEADPVLKDLIIPYETLDTNLDHEHNVRSPPPQRAAKCIYASRAARMAGVKMPVGHPDPTSVPDLNMCPVTQHREPAGESMPATPNRIKYKTQDMMLRAISNAHSGFLADQPSQVVFSHLLAQLLQVTDCEYGFVGDKLYGEDGKPYLKTRALTNISWNSETREFYEANVHSGFEFKNLNSLFGFTLVTDELVISNNPKGDPRSCGGVPPGHPPMHSYLGLPLRSGKQVIGMVGLANRPGGFDEELARFLEPMLSACTNLIEAYNTKKLREQVKAEILQANQQLEENVKQRTQELTIKNQALENEVEFRKKIETQLKLAKEEADRASEAKGIFLSTMSHELRTPLNGVIGMVEVLMDTTLNDEQKEIATTISRSAITLHYLINNILDVSKLEAGKLEFAKARMSVRECLEESIYMVAVLAHQKDLDLVIDIDPTVPYFVMGDVGKLKQIIVNLVHNAVKFTESGSVTLSCTAVPEGQSRTVLQVAVKDTGIGIPEKNLSNLFQMFSQADQSVSQRYGGSGLGLYLTKQLIQFMGGRLSVSSVEGKGSCFSFTLPVEIDTSAGPQPTPVLKHDGVPLKFGIVGLRQGTLHVLQQYLTQWGGEIAFSDCTALDTMLEQTEKLDFVFFGPPSVLEKQCLGSQDNLELLRKVEQKTNNVVLIRSIASLKPHPFAAYLPNAGYLMEPLRPSAILHFIQNHMHGIDSNGSKASLAADVPEVKPAAVKTPEGSPKLSELRRPVEPIQNLKVLLVDDNIVNCQVGQRLVKRLNHDCHIATSGPEAIQKFNAEHYDVIFMDLVMPDMDGFKATQLIREAERMLQRERTPIIALTAAGITREELVPQGFDDLASKPITGNELRAVLSANVHIKQ